jgi:serine/threonine protein kinase
MHDVCKLTGEMGSYRHMVPEVSLDEKYGKSVDVFSFHVILYEMFEGAPPFKEQAAYDATQLAAEEDCWLDMRSKTYPPGMWELIQRCWSTSPKERPLFDNIVQELQMMEEGFL